MQREDWKFDYTAQRLAEAAQRKIDWHRERLAFWSGRREETLATIRAEGLEIDEKIAANPEARLSLDIADWLYFFGAPA